MSSKMESVERGDEEFQMLLDVCEETARQKSGKTTRRKSGDATEIVIRNHLLERELNVTLSPEVKIQGSRRRNDMLLLKANVDSSNSMYTPSEVEIVLEIKNNATPSKRDKKPIDPSIEIRDRFDELERDTGVSRFAVIVLSERLLSRTPYKYRITEEKIGKENCRVFTLIARREYPSPPKYPRGGLSSRTVILQMVENNELWKTEEWDGLVNYLRG